ncbi:MAG: FHA domain-containing protein [Acidobacteria bacterium]|nr:FHA domain-containing protein [Acidobacteriota bacterium]
MPSLVVHDPNGRESRVALDARQDTVLGRDETCQIVLAHPSISRRHAVVALREGAYEVEDLSTNGLFVNGAPVDTHRLANGDTMVLGADTEHPIRFSTEDSRLEMTMTQFQYDFTTGARSDVKNLRRLIEVNKAITTSLEMEEVFELLLEGILEIASVARAMILLKRDDGAMETVYEKNLERSGSSFAGRGISGSVVQRVVESGEPLLINDVADNPDFEAQASIQALDLRSIVAIPLSYSQAYMRTVETTDTLMGIVYVDSRSARRRFEEADLDLMLAFSTQGAISLENAKLHRDLQESYLELVMSLAGAVEIKDRYTRGHSELVSRYAVAIAERFGMSDHEIKVIKRGGLLHDVGKIGIDEAILNKDSGLTEEEFDEIKKHTIYGGEILAPVAFLRGERDIVLQHHEKMDGSGYPYGLEGEETSIGARIIAVCDVFEGVTSNRPYRKPMKPERVVKLLEGEAGDKLDAEVVGIFLGIYEEAGFKKGEVARPDKGVKAKASKKKAKKKKAKKKSSAKSTSKKKGAEEDEDETTAPRA